jgi:hypothetical protein
MTTGEKNEKEWQKQAVVEAFEQLLDDMYFTHAIDLMDPDRIDWELEEFLQSHS